MNVEILMKNYSKKVKDEALTTQKETSWLQGTLGIFINCEAGEIIYLVASVHLSVSITCRLREIMQIRYMQISHMANNNVNNVMWSCYGLTHMAMIRFRCMKGLRGLSCLKRSP